MNTCPACGTEPEEYLRHAGRDYKRCPRCGTIFVPGATPAPDVYDRAYFDKFRGFSGGHDSHELNMARLAFLRPFLAFAENRATVLDFGCGSGDWLNEFWQEFAAPVYGTPMGFPCVAAGVDINPEACKFIRAQFPHIIAYEDLQEAKANYQRRGLLFDLVTAFDVVEHFADPTEMLIDLADMLRPGGLIMLSTPHLPLGDFTPEQFKDWRHCRPLEHFCHFTARGVTLFLHNNGFEIFTTGHPEDGIRRPGPNALGPHNILTVIARKARLSCITKRRTWSRSAPEPVARTASFR